MHKDYNFLLRCTEESQTELECHEGKYTTIQNFGVCKIFILFFYVSGRCILCSPRLHFFFDQITGMQSQIFSIITPVLKKYIKLNSIKLHLYLW